VPPAARAKTGARSATFLARCVESPVPQLALPVPRMLQRCSEAILFYPLGLRAVAVLTDWHTVEKAVVCVGLRCPDML
jgi:hypothetical protein